MSEEPTKKFPAKHMLELHYVVKRKHFHRIEEIASDYEDELASIGLTPAQYVTLVKEYKAWHDGMIRHLPSLIDYFERNNFNPFEDERGFEISNVQILSWLHALQNKIRDGSDPNTYEKLMKKVQEFLDNYEKHLYSLPMAEEPKEDKEMEEYWKRVHDVLGKDYPSYELKEVDTVEEALQGLQSLINALLNPLWLEALPVLQEFEQNLVVHIPRMEAPINWTQTYITSVIRKLDGLIDENTTKSAMLLFHSWYAQLSWIIKYDDIFNKEFEGYMGISEMYNQIGLVSDHLNYAPDYERTVEGLRALLHYIGEVKKQKTIEETEEYKRVVALAKETEIIDTQQIHEFFNISIGDQFSAMGYFEALVKNKILIEIRRDQFSAIGSTKAVKDTNLYAQAVAIYEKDKKQKEKSYQGDYSGISSYQLTKLDIPYQIKDILLEELERNGMKVQAKSQF